MSRRRVDKPLDIYKRLQVVRSSDDLIYDEETETFEKSKAMESDFFKATAVVKKKLNIPVTDIAQDKKYDDDNVMSPFVLPTSYVRHIKIMSDEPDLTVDYCIEDEDMNWLQNNVNIAADTELAAAFTPTLFENMFDLFEKNTGFNDPIPLQMAVSLVSHYLNLPAAVASKVVSELYPYWISKRTKLHKPLCRKYWPSTAPNDTNPHLVFRPREKERYRLRRHHKNDLQSFRRMQSLRREFSRARVLMELVLERELLKKADMEISGEIFEQHMRNLSEQAGGAGLELLVESAAVEGASGGAVKVKQEPELEDGGEAEWREESAGTPSPDPYRYSFRFPHLIPMLEPPKKIATPPPYVALPPEDESALKLTLKLKSSKPNKIPKVLTDPLLANEFKEEKTTRKKKAKTEGQPRGRKRDRSGLAKDGLLSPDGIPIIPVVKERRPTKETKAKKEKEGKEKKEPRDKDHAGNRKLLATAPVMQPLGGRVTIDAKGRMVLHPNQHGNTKVVTSGSSEILLNERLGRMKESMWPTFMDDLYTRQKIYAPRSMSEYLKDLELSGDESDDPPSRFRLRGRIGRGGRIVMDRIPVYNRCTEPKSWQSQPHLMASRSSAHSVSNNCDYIYPTTLHPARQQEHVKMFASHFRKESFYSAGLPDPLQPSPPSEAATESTPPLDCLMDIDIDIEAACALEGDDNTSIIPSLLTADSETNAAAQFEEKIESNAVPGTTPCTVPMEIGSVCEGVIDRDIDSNAAPMDLVSSGTSNNVGDGSSVVLIPGADISAETNGDPIINSLPVDSAKQGEMSEEKEEADSTCQNVYPGSGSIAIGSLAGVHTAEYQSMYMYSDDLTMFPLLLPPERDALVCLPSHREHDLGRLNDQRPIDLKADPQLPFAVQANQLVPREEESTESIISLPRRFRGLSGHNNSHSINRTSDSLPDDSRLANPSGDHGTEPANCQTVPGTSTEREADITDASLGVDSLPLKHTLYV